MLSDFQHFHQQIIQQ